MAKIIQHNFKGKGGYAGRDLLTSSFTFFVGEMEEKKAILGELVMQARLFLSREGMDPSGFILSESYVRDYLFTRLTPEDGQDPYAEVVYLKYQDGKVTAVCQFASPEGDEIAISYQIYALERAAEGNRSWKVYNFQTRSWTQEGEDLFNLERIFHEISLFAGDSTLPGENKD